MATRGDDPETRATTRPTPTVSPSPTSTPTPTPQGEAAEAVKTIEEISTRPAGIAYAGGDMWVMSPYSPFLTRIDTATNRERDDHPKVGLDSTAIVGAGDSVFVTVGSSRLLIAFDARTGNERWRVQVPAGPRRLAVDAQGVWVGTNSPPGVAGLVIRYDPETGELQQQITVLQGVGALASSPEGLWLVKRDTNQLARLDPETGQFGDVVAAPGPVRSMSFGADSLWMVLAEEDTVARYGIDGDGPFTAGAGRNPTTALVAGGLLFVAARNDQSVQVLDTENLRPVQDPIPVGVNPIALAASEDGAVWVTSLGDNTVTRIELR